MSTAPAYPEILTKKGWKDTKSFLAGSTKLETALAKTQKECEDFLSEYEGYENTYEKCRGSALVTRDKWEEPLAMTFSSKLKAPKDSLARLMKEIDGLLARAPKKTPLHGSLTKYKAAAENGKNIYIRETEAYFGKLLKMYMNLTKEAAGAERETGEKLKKFIAENMATIERINDKCEDLVFSEKEARNIIGALAKRGDYEGIMKMINSIYTKHQGVLAAYNTFKSIYKSEAKKILKMSQDAPDIKSEFFKFSKNLPEEAQVKKLSALIEKFLARTLKIANEVRNNKNNK